MRGLVIRQSEMMTQVRPTCVARDSCSSKALMLWSWMTCVRCWLVAAQAIVLVKGSPEVSPEAIAPHSTVTRCSLWHSFDTEVDALLLAA